jgi:predicted O-linked N-acetylglucosamine transferase (SPINDLY family)
LRQAVKLAPGHVETHNHLGIVVAQQGKEDEAVVCFQQALSLRPGFAETHYNLGHALLAQEKLDAAVASFRRAVELRPDWATAHRNLGNALRAQGKLDEAIISYQEALRLGPDVADIHHSLGAVLKARGRLDDAVRCFQRAIERNPNLADAHCNLGSALVAQGKVEQAVTSYRRALELDPNFAIAHSNLGNALKQQGKPEEAIGHLQRAIELRPEFADAHSNLGNALIAQGKLDAAVASFRRAIALKPDYAGAHSNLVYALIFCPGYDARGVYEEARLWSRKHAEPLEPSIRPHSNDRSPDRRLRVGYVSPDFRNHCQSFFTLPLFSAHDHEQFEIFSYSDVLSEDGHTARLRAHADTWREIKGLSDEQVATLVREDAIDILVDLTMHMAHNRLLVSARKPAPVQVSWLAYPGTTGLTTIDYRLTDPLLDPPGMFDRHYSEQSFRLPDAFWCYDPLTSEPAVNRLPALTNDHITFGSLNNFCKINDPVLKLWARVLTATPGARLMLLAGAGSHRQDALRVLEEEGIAADRVTFVSPQLRSKYLKLYHLIDIGLDPFPANGHTTSLDSFWMGVPVITMVGQTAVGRGGLCQLTLLGLPELIAETPEQFVSIAVGLAGDLPRLSMLRETLRDRLQKSPLMNAPRFARNIEAAYRTMWRTWCARERGETAVL